MTRTDNPEYLISGSPQPPGPCTYDMSDRWSNLRQRVRIISTLKRQSPYHQKVVLLLAQEVSIAWGGNNTLQERVNNAKADVP